MRKLYYILNDLIKSYHIVSKFDAKKAADILATINQYRLQIAKAAAQRLIFVEQLNVTANASGYKNDVFFSHDDINSIVSRMIAFLDTTATVTLTQQGTRENLFTREPIAWQHLMSSVQNSASPNGVQVPFDFDQEIYLEKSQTLDIGIISQLDAGMVFVHGCNLADNWIANIDALTREINNVDYFGNPLLPQLQLMPIQFIFPAGVADEDAIAISGGKDNIYSTKINRTVILTEVSTTAVDSRITLIDKGRDMTICDTVESGGIAGTFTNGFANYYPLPFPHLMMPQDRLQLKGINGSGISGGVTAASVTQTLCFRGYTL